MLLLVFPAIAEINTFTETVKRAANISILVFSPLCFGANQ